MSVRTENKRVFGWFEVVFDTLYLVFAGVVGWYLLLTRPAEAGRLAGAAALVLAGGDAFHLIPRMRAVLTGREASLRKALGFGKLVTSITMTVFYLLLWHIGVLLLYPGAPGTWTALAYALAAVRIGLCLFPQNQWTSVSPPVKWGVLRNLPFFALGAAVAVFYGVYGQNAPPLRWAWLAIALSFAFYLPVVVGVNRSRKLGMLMLPKTCAYVWLLAMFLGI